jgi:hypothetical protein
MYLVGVRAGIRGRVRGRVSITGGGCCEAKMYRSTYSSSLALPAGATCREGQE